MGYVRVIHKKKKKKVLKKMDKCLNYQNNEYFDARLKKKRKR